jgi:hypothetical protein
MTEPTTHGFIEGSGGGDYITREEHNDDLIDTKGMLISVINDMHRTLDWTRGLLALTVLALLLVVLTR